MDISNIDRYLSIPSRVYHFKILFLLKNTDQVISILQNFVVVKNVPVLSNTRAQIKPYLTK